MSQSEVLSCSRRRSCSHVLATYAVVITAGCASTSEATDAFYCALQPTTSQRQQQLSTPAVEPLSQLWKGAIGLQPPLLMLCAIPQACHRLNLLRCRVNGGMGAAQRGACNKTPALPEADLQVYTGAAVTTTAKTQHACYAHDAWHCTLLSRLVSTA